MAGPEWRRSLALAIGLLIDLCVNMAAQAPMAFTLGPPAYAMRVTLGLASLLIGIWAGYAWEMVAGEL